MVSNWLEPFVIPWLGSAWSTFAVENQTHRWVLIRQPPEGQAPPWAIGFDPMSQLYFVSEDVPVPFRTPILAHEMFEFGHCANAPGSCQRALMYELSYVEPEMRHTYLSFRLEQLTELREWMRAHPKVYSKEQIQATSENIRVIQALLQAEQELSEIYAREEVVDG